MPTDMLNSVGVAQLTRVSSNSPVSKVGEIHQADQGKKLAAQGTVLPQQGRPSEPTEVEDAVTQINEYVQTITRDLQFSIDEDSGRTVIKVLDTETKEVIRQIPPEELLRIATYMTESGGAVDSGGLLIKAQA